MDTIILKGLRFFSHVGVFPEEKAEGQPFILDLSCRFDKPIAAVDSDRLTESVSYADIYEAVKAVVEPARFDLIEHLAGQVADTVLTQFPIDCVLVTVKKPQAPIDGEFDYMGVQIERSRIMHTSPKEMHTYCCDLSLGSNLGDREAYLIAGLSDLSDHSSIVLKSVSSLYETKPWGVTDQQNFLNAVARIETTMNPFELLHVLQAVELKHGRERDVRWGARTLDLDILAIENVTIASPELTVPHPLIQDRPFVFIPLAEVNGDVVPADETVIRRKTAWYCPSRTETVV